jgi:acetylornithine deacetylase/succinyl-diaminopimelate desuccinylase-like protein
MENIKNYIEENKQRFLDELFELIRIPSISSEAKHKPDMYKAAEYWKKLLLEAGADKAEVLETEGNPVTYGEKIIDPKLPTVLVYGHMDVMPVDPIELWISPPFEPEIREGKIYARGADDDKGQAMMHAKAFEFMVKTQNLPCNVKFMLEGEEEIGSPSLGKFCEDNKEMLKSDIILVSDTSMIAQDIPSITTGLRGLSFMEVEVTGPNKDLHSGLFGGAVANPANILAKMIASLTDEDNKIMIKGFYDDVLVVNDDERAEMAKAPFNLDEYKKALDLEEVDGEKRYSTNERTGIRPSLDVNGIWGGYTGEGAKTVLPSKACAKISMRLVPNQDNKKISQLFEEHFKAIAPKTVKVKVTALHGGQGYVSPTDMLAYHAADKAYSEAFGKKPVPVRSGGSIPIISTFEAILGVKSILMGFGLESDAIHSPNENYPLFNFYKGIETIPLFYKYFAEMMKDLS